MGAIVERFGAGLTAEQVCEGLIRLLRKSQTAEHTVLVGTSAVEILPPDPNRIAIFPGQPDAGSIRIMPYLRPSANQGILVSATGSVEPMSIFTLASMAIGPWYGIADAANRSITLITSTLNCG